MANLYDDEDQNPAPPAPNTPPVTPPGGIGPGGPPIGVPPKAEQPTNAPVGGQGGGPGPAPWSLPGIPGLNIPGAPVFNAPKYVAPDKNSIFNDPGYQARLDAGNRALERSAAARGMLRGGNTLTGLADWNQNAASQEYQNAVNRYNNEYQANYRAAYDAFAPQMARYNILAGGMRDLQRDRYQADLNHALQLGQPHGGGGGGEPDLSWLTQLPQPPMAPPGGLPAPGMPGQGSPYNPEAQNMGDPWTEYF